MYLDGSFPADAHPVSPLFSSPLYCQKRQCQVGDLAEGLVCDWNVCCPRQQSRDISLVGRHVALPTDFGCRLEMPNIQNIIGAMVLLSVFSSSKECKCNVQDNCNRLQLLSRSE
jgi:hypothetical protein